MGKNRQSRREVVQAAEARGEGQEGLVDIPLGGGVGAPVVDFDIVPRHSQSLPEQGLQLLAAGFSLEEELGEVGPAAPGQGVAVSRVAQDSPQFHLRQAATEVVGWLMARFREGLLQFGPQPGDQAGLGGGQRSGGRGTKSDLDDRYQNHNQDQQQPDHAEGSGGGNLRRRVGIVPTAAVGPEQTGMDRGEHRNRGTAEWARTEPGCYTTCHWGLGRQVLEDGVR